MKLHVLPGDAIRETFTQAGIEGEVVVCRECLIDGEVKADNLDEFWNVRAIFLDEAYGEVDGTYFENVTAELEKLRNLRPDVEVNLWFEYELFCNTNMWFCLSLLRGTKAKVYRVEPIVGKTVDKWKGFGALEPKDLTACFAKRKELGSEDIGLGADLWTAYQNTDHAELTRLSSTRSDRFPFLEEVVAAEIEKKTRPKQILAEITDSGVVKFKDIFAEFSLRAGVYGFGDAQVKRILLKEKFSSDMKFA